MKHLINWLSYLFPAFMAAGWVSTILLVYQQGTRVPVAPVVPPTAAPPPAKTPPDAEPPAKAAGLTADQAESLKAVADWAKADPGARLAGQVRDRLKPQLDELDTVKRKTGNLVNEVGALTAKLAAVEASLQAMRKDARKCDVAVLAFSSQTGLDASRFGEAVKAALAERTRWRGLQVGFATATAGAVSLHAPFDETKAVQDVQPPMSGSSDDPKLVKLAEVFAGAAGGGDRRCIVVARAGTPPDLDAAWNDVGLDAVLIAGPDGKDKRTEWVARCLRQKGLCVVLTAADRTAVPPEFGPCLERLIRSLASREGRS